MRPSHATTAIVLALPALILQAAPRDPAPRKSNAHHPNNILVRFRPERGAVAQNPALLPPGVRRAHEYRAVRNLVLLEVPDGELDRAMAAYRADPNVLYAEPDFVVRMQAVPNDPFFNLLWGMQNTGQTVNQDPGIADADSNTAPAWDFWTGDPTFRIAVVDTGIDYNHEDLQANIWTNPGEIPGNGIDDDGNGWIDDIHGYNTLLDNGDPMDTSGHGTHVAGTIGAAGNNGIGVAGVNWQCQLVALKFGEGTAYLSDVIEAIDYILDNDIKLSNNSWGCDRCYSQALYDAIAATQQIGHVFVAAAGNGFLGLGYDTDEFPFYPAAYDLPNIVAVAATDNNDRKALFSNFGPQSIDIAAPGVNVYSTLPGSTYGFLSGTSMATPHVTGTLALLMSRRPELPPDLAREHLLRTARPLPVFAGRTVTDSIVDTLGAVADCNRNGTLDEQDVATGLSDDCNGNGLPDECEPDCNANEVEDSCDLAMGISLDCDENLVPDECQPDCNGNGRADPCDVATGFSPDCNANLLPDECEPGWDEDCNETGSPDLCDIHYGAAIDCNNNDIPDTCDLAAGASEDCTINGVPDECERDCNENDVADSCDIADGTSQDQDLDGVPDECALGLSIVPVHATGEYTIQGNHIHVEPGGQRILLEFRWAGWDPDLDGTPRIDAYGARIIPSLFRGGERGSVALATGLPCVDNDDCLGDSTCGENGICDDYGAININRDDPHYIFAGLDVIAFSALQPPEVIGVLWDTADAVQDTGDERYIGTMILETSADAGGTFVIEFEQGPATGYTDETGTGHDIPAANLFPARITIPYDCNGNGIDDDKDIADGTSRDCNANLIPDDCLHLETDCNGNRVPDVCDIASGRSRDREPNGVPDECQPVLHVPGEYPTIQEAIDHAEPDATILVADGIYTGPGNTNLVISRPGALTVRSVNGPSRCVIDCQENGWGIWLMDGGSEWRVEGFTITGATESAIRITRADPLVRRCNLVDNTSKWAHTAGAIYADNSYARFEECTMARNETRGFGGAAHLSDSTITFRDCMIVQNIAGDAAGAVAMFDSSATFTRCAMLGNEGLRGGAVYVQNPELVTMSNCVLAGNRGGLGGAVLVGSTGLGSRMELSNCTVAMNAAHKSSAAIKETNGVPVTIDNSIIWGNTPGPLEGYAFTLSYSNIQDAYAGTGNMNADPLFVDPAGPDGVVGTEDDDFRLAPGSPCVDAGDPAFLPEVGAADLDGHARLLCGRVDMGAYELGIGDFNCDDETDLADFAAWPVCMTGPPTQPPAAPLYLPGCEAFDTQANGAIDLHDYAEVQRILSTDYE